MPWKFWQEQVRKNRLTDTSGQSKQPRFCGWDGASSSLAPCISPGTGASGKFLRKRTIELNFSDYSLHEIKTCPILIRNLRYIHHIVCGFSLFARYIDSSVETKGQIKWVSENKVSICALFIRGLWKTHTVSENFLLCHLLMIQVTS